MTLATASAGAQSVAVLQTQEGGPPPAASYILLENGDFVLLEDGISKVIKEAA